MDGSVVQGALGMARGSVLRIQDAPGLVVQVHEGALWLTQEGDALDRYIGPGGTFRLDRGGLAIAQAISRHTLLTVIPPRRRRPAGLWARLFAAHSQPASA
jgi:hypothetical protein